METWVSILCVVAVMTTGASAEQLNFGSLPEVNYTADSVGASPIGSLTGVFDMAKGFVNVVLATFQEVNDYITALLNNDDPWSYFSQNWQEAASLQAGYIACIVFGLLFVLLMPIVGSIMCCCRCCCNNCGGRLDQSERRSKSCHRQCLCVTMLILTTFMAVPTVFVFLTNEWAKDAVDAGPAKAIAAINDMSAYINSLPTEADYIANQYSEVDDNIRPLVTNMDQSIGVPLQQFVNDSAQESLNILDEAIKETNLAIETIDTIDQSLTEVSTGLTDLDASLADLQSRMNAELSNSMCTDDDSCEAVLLSTTKLGLGINVSDITDLQMELRSVNDSLTEYDISGLKTEIDNQINDIPSEVKSNTASASEDGVEALDKVQDQITDFEQKVPNLTQVDDQLTELQTSINNFLTFYDDNIDQYTYIGGVVLGCMLLIIVASYYVGIVLGVCGQDDVDPTDRTCSSNCGGIMLMVGVGFSFIFSWLLMILVIVLFTIGGYGERYGCQGLEKPYPLLDVLEGNFDVNLASAVGLPSDVPLTIPDLLNSCENDASAYNALKLEYVYNVTALYDQVNDTLNETQSTINEAVDAVDVSSFSVYSEQDQQNLETAINSTSTAMDFYSETQSMGTKVTATDLTVYANFLRASADNFTTASAAFNATVYGYAAEVDQIQANKVAPLQSQYDEVLADSDLLLNTSIQLQGTLTMLDDSLIALNGTIQNQGPQVIQNITNDLYKQIESNVTTYVDWVVDQVTNNFGACRPLYDSYTALVGVFCDYLINTINGLWFSLGWAVFFLIPSLIVAMKLMKFYRRMQFQDEFDNNWENMEMGDFAGGSKTNGGYY